MVDVRQLLVAGAAIGVCALLASIPDAAPVPNKRGRGPCHKKALPSDYLFPDERRYPVPTEKCARTALTYAAWPNNLYDAPRVVERLRKTKWWFKPRIRAQAEALLRKYKREYRKAA